MADTKNNGAGDGGPAGRAVAATATAAAAATAAPRPESLRFEVRTPNTGFRGERAGVRFNDGVGYTDDAVKAHALLEFGYCCHDRKGDVYHPESNPELVGKLFGDAAAASLVEVEEKKSKARRDK